MTAASGSSIWSSKGSSSAASSTSLLVRVEATIVPVFASTARCSFLQARRRWVPCFSTSHSPGPFSFTPVLSGAPVRSPPGEPPPVSWIVGSRSNGSCAGPDGLRHRQVQPHQPEQRADQPFGLAQRLVKHCPQDQRCLDREVRVARLAARRGPRRRSPGSDRLLTEPH